MRRFVAVSAAGVMLGLSEVALKDQLAPDHCRWCSVPGIDADVHDSLTWSDRRLAGTFSNVTAYLLVPLSAGGGLLASAPDADRWETFADDTLALVETAAYTQLADQIVKFTFGRQRPYAHFHPTTITPSNDDNLSFFSGHTTWAFGIATTAGVIAHQRRTKLEPVIWATGYSLAALTGYLRIAAEKHYLTDVLAGAAFGAAAGVLVPHLTGALPVVPTDNGIAIVGQF